MPVAKHGRKGRKFRRYIKGRMDVALSLTTLGANTLVSLAVDDVVTEKCWVSSVVATYALDQFTMQAGDGPIVVGLANANYSDAEIEAYLELNTSWDEGDLVDQEIARRKIKIVGVFRSPVTATEVQVLNDGLPLRTKLGWSLRTGHTLKVWAYNQGDSALATTVPQVHVLGHANLWPQ